MLAQCLNGILLPVVRRTEQRQTQAERGCQSRRLRRLTVRELPLSRMQCVVLGRLEKGQDLALGPSLTARRSTGRLALRK